MSRCTLAWARRFPDHPLPMQSRWSDAEAKEFVDYYKDDGEDVALRVYTSRLIGSDSFRDTSSRNGNNLSI